ncbi:unnamed protein product [Soboliphyme baturini]|uniref:Fibronectin type-III domain-containing protein n=1 Tax=Soboliphyme baturini TaxID=241478 RepID=A0A183I9N5_9BILA|nr:unnamed protein product [Soboliphyme baturini]
MAKPLKFDDVETVIMKTHWDMPGQKYYLEIRDFSGSYFLRRGLRMKLITFG